MFSHLSNEGASILTGNLYDVLHELVCNVNFTLYVHSKYNSICSCADHIITQNLSLSYATKPEMLSQSKSASIHILALNVCGLKSKLRTDDFEKHLNNFDIACLTETES